MQEEFQDRPNHFQNRTGPKGDWYNGTRGKFNESQTEFRAKLHARSMATHFPKMAEFPSIFKEKFNIDISLESEKQWRRCNLELINKKRQEMVETGEIEVVTIGPKAISENLQAVIVKSYTSLSKIQRKMHSCIESLDKGSKIISDGNKSFVVNDDLDKFKALSAAYAQINNSIAKHIETLSNIAGTARGLEKEQDEAEFKAEAAKIDKGFDPSAVEISDADREAVE